MDQMKYRYNRLELVGLVLCKYEALLPLLS